MRALTSQLFTALAALIETRIGLSFTPRELAQNEARLTTLALETGCDSLFDYYHRLREAPADARDFAALAELLAVHETYFFRELDQLRVLADDVLLPRVRAGTRPRVWHAGCSTGEEPFTLAMLLADRGVLEQVQILATDISARVIDHASEAQYAPRALRGPPPSLARGRLEVSAAGIAVHRTLRAAVRWRTVNLVDPAAVRALGTWDAIVCRNVLIYFSDETARRTTARLADALVPGGVLLVGASESLQRFGTPLVCEEHSGAFLYRKPAAT